eukprot:6202102-Pleurochrysis_carterae.AAC.2
MRIAYSAACAAHSSAASRMRSRSCTRCLARRRHNRSICVRLRAKTAFVPSACSSRSRALTAAWTHARRNARRNVRTRLVARKTFSAAVVAATAATRRHLATHTPSADCSFCRSFSRAFCSVARPRPARSASVCQRRCNSTRHVSTQRASAFLSAVTAAISIRHLDDTRTHADLRSKRSARKSRTSSRRRTTTRANAATRDR